MSHPMVILTLVPLTQYGHGGVAGEEAGVAAEVVGAAGGGLHLTGTRGGKTTD
jgi:hypothetical protein